MKRSRLGPLLTILIVAASCSSGSSPSSSAAPTTPSSPTPPPAASVVSLAVTGAAPKVGQTAPFIATATLSDRTTQAVTSQATWSSSNAVVATVTNAGVVTGVGVGIADITATYQGTRGTSHVTVDRAMYTVSGHVTDGTSGGVLPNISIQTIDSDNTVRSTRTDGAGDYAIAGVLAGPVMLSASAVSYQTQTMSVTVSSDTRIDIVLARTPPPPTYAGVWTGTFQITSCQDTPPPGWIPICGYFVNNQTYRFTLAQSGTTVTGTYTQMSYMLTECCRGTYDMSGMVTSDGSLALSGAGRTETLLFLEITFNLRQTSSSMLTGTIVGDFRAVSGNGVVVATFSGPVLSGTR
jgi:hypothetical protein